MVLKCSVALLSPAALYRWLLQACGDSTLHFQDSGFLGV